MKEDAILVNLARGELVDEEALYLHLRDHGSFVRASTRGGSSRCGTDVLKSSSPSSICLTSLRHPTIPLRAAAGASLASSVQRSIARVHWRGKNLCT